jgi:hypothetical protein
MFFFVKLGERKCATDLVKYGKDASSTSSVINARLKTPVIVKR